MARPSNTAQRRDEIAASFIEVMAATGYAGATMAAVAERAGIPQGLIHHHFDGKLDLLMHSVGRLERRLVERYETRLRRTGTDPVRRLLAFVDAHVALGADADRASVTAWVCVGAEAVAEPAVRRIYVQALRRRRDELRELFAAASAPRTSRARVLESAGAVAAAIEGIFQVAAVDPTFAARGHAVRTMRRMTLGLLR